MVVLAVPIGKTFEVAMDKVELFEKDCKNHNGKQIILERLKQHSKGDIVWNVNYSDTSNREFPYQYLKE